MSIKTVCFVCTGNTCRSPMAACYFKSLVRDDVFTVLSAGICAQSGAAPSQFSVDVMAQNHLCLDQHASRLLDGELLQTLDWIVVMTESHKQAIVENWPHVRDKIFLLREFDDSVSSSGSFIGSMDIMDPIGGTEEDYRNCFEMMKTPLKRLGETLCKES